MEDDPEIARYIMLLLNQLPSAKVEHYPDGLDGLVGILSSPPDLAVLDLELPSLRGEEICRRLRSSRLTRETPVVICSSMPEPQRREMELLRLGADAYLPKPFPADRFLETVDRLLAVGRSQYEEEETLPADQRRQSGASAATDPPPPLPDSDFAGYRLQTLIGGGGMGTVYRAYDPANQREVALKVLLRNLAGVPQAVERFLREGRIMASLDHPNIVRVYDSGRTPYSYHIVMEYVDGESLEERLEEGRLGWSRQVEVARDLLDAVEYLHSRGVLHRDLKPSNVLLSEEGRAKLTDFGISRAEAFAGDPKLTRDASLIGTPTFMAPEQFQGAEATVATDIYSLGRTLQMLFEGGPLSLPPRPLEETRPDLPAPLREAIARCLSPDPAQRFSTTGELRTAIVAACSEAPVLKARLS